MSTTDRKTLTLQYLTAAGQQQCARIAPMLTPDFQFHGPSLSHASAAEYLAALQRLSAIHVRNDIRRVFVDGDEVCVIYDFVTDTPAGALPTIEWLRFDGDRIRSIDLYYDRLPWQAVMATIAERAARPAAQPVA